MYKISIPWYSKNIQNNAGESSTFTPIFRNNFAMPRIPSFNFQPPKPAYVAQPIAQPYAIRQPNIVNNPVPIRQPDMISNPRINPQPVASSELENAPTIPPNTALQPIPVQSINPFYSAFNAIIIEDLSKGIQHIGNIALLGNPMTPQHIAEQAIYNEFGLAGLRAFNLNPKNFTSPTTSQSGLSQPNTANYWLENYYTNTGLFMESAARFLGVETYEIHEFAQHNLFTAGLIGLGITAYAAISIYLAIKTGGASLLLP
jgi:hypothetical protein